MRFILTIISVHLLAIALLIGGGTVWVWHSYHAPGPLTEEKTVIVPPGYGVAMIADKLEKEGVVEQPLLFRFMARVTGRQSGLKAGEYAFDAHLSMKGVLDLLESGKVVQRSLTIREGLTSFEVIQILKNAPELSGDIDENQPEGSLLPETYSYQKDEARDAVALRMKEAMTRTLDELWESRDEDLPFTTKEEALVLASIVEKETAVAGERNRIAGVFVNRLRKGIALQTDPSVIYALTGGKPENKGKGPLGRRLLKKDLEVDSPYNTYLYPGLPPGPIANPGRAAIEAALHPEENDFLFFVADGTGGHVFAKTLEEHNANVAQWRKIRSQQKK
ncbi:MAG: endolytic transglycosylase MltG [Alphaproteobacteria bacterium]|nr:endolytic transglycosylase MltG [Alphaproteobacteria bacterium]